MKTTLALAPRISFARITSHKSDAWLDLFAVMAFTLSTFMALTVGGGIWMFYRYSLLFSEGALPGSTSNTAAFAETFLVCAYIAGVLLVLPIFSLGGSAARLGARGRTLRLASLRLIGMTTSQTIVLALVESISQWLIGTIVGTALYYICLPCWSAFTFFQRPVDPHMMILPIKFVALIIVVLFLIAIASTIAGLSRVRISPLGVARREGSPELRAWRPAVFILAICTFFFWAVTYSGTINYKTRVLVTGLFLFFIVSGVLIVGGWILQLLVRPFVYSSSASVLLAARRILDDPRASWRPIATLSILSLIGGLVSIVPTDDLQDGWVIQDIHTGTLLTLAFGFVISALSTLMNQSSIIFDRADQTLALKAMGTPKSVFSRTRILQVLAPLTFTTTVSASLGLSMSLATASSLVSAGGIMRILWVMLIGIGLCFVALLLCEPLERNVLGARGRRND